jgi:hypothetical protein
MIYSTRLNKDFMDNQKNYDKNILFKIHISQEKCFCFFYQSHVKDAEYNVFIKDNVLHYASIYYTKNNDTIYKKRDITKFLKDKNSYNIYIEDRNEPILNVHIYETQITVKFYEPLYIFELIDTKMDNFLKIIENNYIEFHNKNSNINTQNNENI